jgi:hypothetical protein
MNKYIEFRKNHSKFKLLTLGVCMVNYLGRNN